MCAGGCEQFSDELIELYTLGCLTRTEAAAFEEHFLVCAACQERLKASDDFVVAARLVGIRLPAGKATIATGAGPDNSVRSRWSPAGSEF